MTRPKLDLGSMGGSPEELRDAMQSLTDTFSKMLGKDFDLVNAPSGSTDCETFFRVPLDDPEAYIILEHEISHPFAGTNLALTEVFREKTVEKLLRRAGINKKNPAGAPYRQKLAGIIHHLWNVLEDWRCCSVWGELYPGGAALLKQRWKDIAEYEMQEQAEKDIVSYLGRVAAGVDTPTAPPEFQACAKHMIKARSRVELVDNKACLALTRKLIDDIADELLKQFPPQQPQTFRQSSLNKLSLLNQAITGSAQGKAAGDNEDNPLGGKDLSQAVNSQGKPLKKVTAAMTLEIDELVSISDTDGEADEDGNMGPSSLQKMLDQGTDAMFQVIQAAKKELGAAKKGSKQGEEEALLSAAKMTGIKGVVVTPSQKLPKYSRGAARMRRYLEQVKMRKERKRAVEGEELDIEAYIEAYASGNLNEAKLFKKVKKYGGMDLLLLIDVSGSMYGAGLDLVEQAMANIDFACHGIKVTLHVWAFSSDLFFFKKIGSPKNVPNMNMAMTNMVQALDAAWEWAKHRKKDRAVLMITDGFPTSCRGRRSSGNPVEDLHTVLRDMRLDEIVVSILAIGDSQTDYYDTAFGKRRYGLVKNLGDLSGALEDSARVMIESHIMSR